MYFCAGDRVLSECVYVSSLYWCTSVLMTVCCVSVCMCLSSLYWCTTVTGRTTWFICMTDMDSRFKTFLCLGMNQYNPRASQYRTQVIKQCKYNSKLFLQSGAKETLSVCLFVCLSVCVPDLQDNSAYWSKGHWICTHGDCLETHLVSKMT